MSIHKPEQPSLERRADSPYADISGRPYPLMPLGNEDVTLWMEGMRTIERRMREEEKAIVASIKKEVEAANSQQGIEEIVRRHNERSTSASRDTVLVRNITVKIATGEDVSLAVMFEPRVGVEHKDDPIRFTLQAFL